jgi:predicted porin
MKKSLLAVAAMGAFASAAQAQSSVTVYGVMDLGYVGSNLRTANNAAASNGQTITNVQNSQFTDAAESTSRLGFKGTEDLGGGLSAFFTIETAITPNGQNAISSAVSTANRQSFVGLKKNGVGQFAFGTQYTTIHNAVAATDPGMQNNIMGNVIYDKLTGGTALTQSQSVGTSGTTGSAQYSGMQNNTSYTVRATNMLSLATDTFAGFQGNAFYVLNNQNAASQTVAVGSGGYTGGTTNHTAWGLGANYTWHKLFVTANYQNFTDKAAYTVTNSNGIYTTGQPIMNGYGGTSVTGTNAKDNQQYYAATYDFGILKAYVQYVNRKTMDVNNPNNYVARTAQQIGVRSFITPTIESWASAGTGKLTVAQGTTGSNTFVTNTTAMAGSNAVNFGGFQLGSNYWLSKRTNLYAIYGQERTSNQSWTQNGNPTSYNSNNYAVGVRHTF